jgi:hypothetical protein
MFQSSDNKIRNTRTQKTPSAEHSNAVAGSSIYNYIIISDHHMIRDPEPYRAVIV